MTFIEKLDLLMARRHLNKHTFAEQSGIPYTTIVNIYKRGYEKMYMSTLWKIADFFDVPIDYLAIDRYENPEDFKPGPNIPVETTADPGEAELLACYRSINKAAQITLLNTARAFAGNPDMQKEDGASITA